VIDAAAQTNDAVAAYAERLEVLEEMRLLRTIW